MLVGHTLYAIRVQVINGISISFRIESCPLSGRHEINLTLRSLTSTKHKSYKTWAGTRVAERLILPCPEYIPNRRNKYTTPARPRRVAYNVLLRSSPTHTRSSHHSHLARELKIAISNDQAYMSHDHPWTATPFHPRSSSSVRSDSPSKAIAAPATEWKHQSGAQTPLASIRDTNTWRQIAPPPLMDLEGVKGGGWWWMDFND